MSWLTVIWSMCVAACGVIALLHLGLAFFDHNRRTNLLVVLIAVGGAATTAGELVLMKTSSIDVCRIALLLGHVALFLLLVPMVWFIHHLFGTGRPWLAWLATGIWGLAIVANFTQPDSLTFSAINGLVKETTFWGESFTRIDGERNPLALMADLGVLLILIYVIHASAALFRTGNKRRATLVGGSIVLFIIAAMAHVPLVDLGILRIPTMIGLSLMPIVAALSCEVIFGVVASSRLTHQVEENERRWRLLLEDIQLLVVGLDREGRFTYVNPHMLKVSGYTSEELIGQSFEMAIPPSDIEKIRHLIAEASGGKLHEHTNTHLQTKAGDLRTITWSAALVRDQNDVITGTLSVGRDMTDRLRAEESLRETRTTLERAQRLNTVGELTASLAHELNQPLAAILSNAQAARRFMQAEPPNLSELPDILDDIVRDDRRASSVISRFRAIMRSGPIETEPCDLHQIIHEAIDLCRIDLNGQKIALNLYLDANAPLVDAGRVELQQVLLNLIFNAIRALKETENPQLDIRTSDDSSDVCVELHDSGPGIAADILPSLFEPFSTTREDGLGMGLAICHRLLELHDGKISASNRPNGGAEFTITLPKLEHTTDA